VGRGFFRFLVLSFVFLFLQSSVRVGASVDFPESVDVDVGVDLGGFEPGVT
jgi:hypothetical protein